MSSVQEGRQYGAPPRGSQESYRSYNNNNNNNNNSNASRNEHENLAAPNRRGTNEDSTNTSNGQRRFLGSLPENAQLSQGSLPPPADDPPPVGREQDQVKMAAQSQEKERQHSAGGKPGKPQRTCSACGENLTGQFVRALDGTFHLECFKCKDCGSVVASKFFPMEDQDSGEGPYPLCETDYFRRLDLLCFSCGGALRGSYVTALDHKYHIDHFTCSVCPTAFGAKDSYYEHDGNVYCHYHYSTRFAQRCNGCQTAILKQFVEIFRNGQNQHWHPECYMIHKFWNVRLTSSSKEKDNQEASEQDASDEKRAMIRIEEEQMEDRTYRIWSVLSAFEETSAACISDMLLHVSNGAYMEGVLVAKKFIQHVDLLFSATDRLDVCMAAHGMHGLSYGREAKLLCKRIVAFFTLLTKTQDTGVKRLGVTQELLSLVTGLAHYLKLLIRISLQGALKLEREKQTNEGLNIFLEDLGQLDQIKETNASVDETASLSDLADEDSDCCIQCNKPIDEECLKLGQRRCHAKHLPCSNCQREVFEVGLGDAIFYPDTQQAYCGDCATTMARSNDDYINIEHITRLQQYVYLLRVALARLLAVLRSGGILPHTSDDPNLSTYDSTEGHRLDVSSSGRPTLSPDSRSKSFGGSSTHEQNQNQSSYSETVGEMKRLRSTRMDKHLSTTMRQARRSRIIPDTNAPGENNFRIEDEQDSMGQARADLNIDKNALTLDDIPRIVAAEQIKEQRPNAYRHAQSKLLGTERPAKFMTGHQRAMSGGADPGGSSTNAHRERTKKYFSELTALEYFIVRHVAVLQMQPLLEGVYTLEDLLSLIETRKQTFWTKLFKGEKQKNSKKKGVFGVGIESLVERDGVDCEQGIGPGALRVPGLLDDAINAMRQMDMSIEGIFRKNGNIRRNKELAEKIDAKETEVDLSKENPVQVAALLKKFLRDMPDPLLTFKLYNIFLASQKIKDASTRMRLLHLTCCLLPKANRDSLEVLFHFLNWAASFAEVDAESGSKMDSHNIATVMAPNILYPDPKVPGLVDESFISIEAVHMLLENNDQLCEVPEDIQSVLSDSEVFNNPAELTTKEILRRYGDVQARQPERHQASTRPEAADMPPIRNTENEPAPSNSRAGAPVPIRVHTDPYQLNASQKESSVRHVQQNGGGGSAYSTSNQNTPPQYQHGFESRGSPYHQRGVSHEGGRDYGAQGRNPPTFGRSNVPASDAN